MTCSSIKYRGFLPLIKDVNNIASASFEIWVESPGKIIVGKFVEDFMNLSLSSNLSSDMDDPPIRTTSNCALLILFIIKGRMGSFLESGSIRAHESAPLFFLLSSNF